MLIADFCCMNCDCSHHRPSHSVSRRAVSFAFSASMAPTSSVSLFSRCGATTRPLPRCTPRSERKSDRCVCRGQFLSARPLQPMIHPTRNRPRRGGESRHLRRALLVAQQLASFRPARYRCAVSHPRCFAACARSQSRCCRTLSTARVRVTLRWSMRSVSLISATCRLPR